MKRSLLFLLALVIGIATMAQKARVTNPRLVQAVPAVAVDLPEVNPQQSANPSVNSKAVLEDDLGQTRYDLQTNTSIQERIHLYPDGTMAGAWTTSTQDVTWSDRGSGYNYFDGTSWITPPVTTRIESIRTGWPSVAEWNGGGEIIMAHATAPNFVTSTRPVKGTGAWTQTLSPPAPADVPAMAWPRMITNGPNNQYVHVIGLTNPSGNPPGVVYKGLDGALLYFRSMDGGATWDKPGIQLPGMDSSNYTAFSGDGYAWGDPVNDTIYFIIGGPYLDTFIMKSTDNGETWTKIPILSNANKKIPLTSSEDVAPWVSTAGTHACQMDKNGIIHVATGIGGGSKYGTSKYISLNRNGLIYWNTTMSMLQDSLDLDTLESRGQLLGYYEDGPNPEDTLKLVTGYRIGLCGFPQMSVDEYNNLYVIYSQVTWESPSTADINYRHIFGRAKFHDQDTWSTLPIDLNYGINYFGKEFIFAAMTKKIEGDKLRMLYQTADEPGTGVGSGTANPPISMHDNTIQYREVPCSTFWPTGIGGTRAADKNLVSQNYPNPVKGSTSFNVQIDRPSNVTIEVSSIMGQRIMTVDKGLVNNGVRKFTIDCSQLSSGIYFYTVRISGESYTHKMIVE